MANGQTPEKKGMPPLVWVGIGCGVLALIAFVAVVGLVGYGAKKAQDFVDESGFRDNPMRAAAEMMVKLNPELELVESDEEAGTITVRKIDTGEVVTLNFEDVAEGRFSVTTDEGEYSVDAGDVEGGGVRVRGPDGEARFGAGRDLDDVPGWVPRYPDLTEATSAFSSKSGDQASGMLTAKTGDAAGEVVEYYRGELEDAGYEITEQTTTSGEGRQHVLIGRRDGGERSVTIAVIDRGEGTEITTQYNGRGE